MHNRVQDTAGLSQLPRLFQSFGRWDFDQTVRQMRILLQVRVRRHDESGAFKVPQGVVCKSVQSLALNVQHTMPDVLLALAHVAHDRWRFSLARAAWSCEP
jgi:hypothetical protein